MLTTLAEALQPLTTSSAAPALVGRSPLFLRLREDVRNAAERGCRSPVLIVGESGSGRTAAAAALCDRLDGNPVRLVLDLASLSGEQIAERLQTAGPNAVILLESVDLAPDVVHAALLRLLRNGAFTSADRGETARLVMTCDAGVAPRETGLPRELWRRLSANAILVPSLRDRHEDVPLLVEHFASLEAAAALEPPAVFAQAALQAMSEYSWPGNVAQLKAVVGRLVASHALVRADDLPVGIRPRSAPRRSHRRQTVADELFRRIVVERLSFWQLVHPLFMGRHITRADVRSVVQRVLDAAQGDDLTVMRLLNMPMSERGRFLRFLRTYECL